MFKIIYVAHILFLSNSVVLDPPSAQGWRQLFQLEGKWQPCDGIPGEDTQGLFLPVFILEIYQLTNSLAEAGAASTLFICPEWVPLPPNCEQVYLGRSFQLSFTMEGDCKPSIYKKI